MKSAFSFRGHPLHVVLVDFPIALWVTSFLADLAYLWRGDAYWFQAAWDLMAAGIAFAVLAAVPGVVDYFKSAPPHSEAKTMARTHGLLNGGVTVLYAFNLWWRTGPGTVEGTQWWVAFALSLVGVGTLGYTGWLGGELVFVHRMGIRENE